MPPRAKNAIGSSPVLTPWCDSVSIVTSCPGFTRMIGGRFAGMWPRITLGDRGRYPHVGTRSGFLLRHGGQGQACRARAQQCHEPSFHDRSPLKMTDVNSLLQVDRSRASCSARHVGRWQAAARRIGRWRRMRQPCGSASSAAAPSRGCSSSTSGAASSAAREVVAIVGRSGRSRGKPLAEEFGVRVRDRPRGAARQEAGRGRGGRFARGGAQVRRAAAAGRASR